MLRFLPQIFRHNTVSALKFPTQGRAARESVGENMMAFGSISSPPADVKVMGYDLSTDRGPRMVYGAFPTP